MREGRNSLCAFHTEPAQTHACVTVVYSAHDSMTVVTHRELVRSTYSFEYITCHEAWLSPHVSAFTQNLHEASVSCKLSKIDRLINDLILLTCTLFDVTPSQFSSSIDEESTEDANAYQAMRSTHASKAFAPAQHIANYRIPSYRWG